MRHYKHNYVTYGLFNMQCSCHLESPVFLLKGFKPFTRDVGNWIETLRWMGSFQLVRHLAGTWSSSRSFHFIKRTRCLERSLQLDGKTAKHWSRPWKTTRNNRLTGVQPLESGQSNGLPGCSVHLHKWVLSQVYLEKFVTNC